LFIVFVALLPVANGALAQDAFRFAVVSDSLAGNEWKTEKCTDENSGVGTILPVMVQHLLGIHKSRPVSLILYPGDLIAGRRNRDKATVAECNLVQLQRWREIVSPLVDAGIPIRITVGNHDAESTVPHRVRCGQHNWLYMPDMANFEALVKVCGDMREGVQGPASDLGWTYSFDMGSMHFIMLNAFTMFENNSFSNETIKWLIDDLEKAQTDGRTIFVASHTPAFPGGTDRIWSSLPFYDPTYNCEGYQPPRGIDRRNQRDRFWNILKQHKVVAYFAGHDHNLQVQQVEGVWHVIAGGLSEELDPLNGAKQDKNSNRILYDGEWQNPRALELWPWMDDQKSYWGYVLATIQAERMTLEVYGTNTRPQAPDEIKLLKTFELRGKR